MSHSFDGDTASFSFDGGLTGGPLEIIVETDHYDIVVVPGLNPSMHKVTINADDVIDLVVTCMDKRKLYERVMARLLDD